MEIFAKIFSESIVRKFFVSYDYCDLADNQFSKNLYLFNILQTHHADYTLKRRGNGRFHVVSTWNTRGVFAVFDWILDMLLMTAPLAISLLFLSSLVPF